MAPTNPERWYGFGAYTGLGPTFIHHETREGAAHLRAQEPDPAKDCAPIAEYVLASVAARETAEAVAAVERYFKAALEGMTGLADERDALRAQVAGLEARVEKLRRALLTIERSCRNPRARGVAAHEASQVAGNAIVADNAAKEAPRG